MRIEDKLKILRGKTRPIYCEGEKHKWGMDYYGERCQICGMFYPYGSAPWDPEWNSEDEWGPEDDGDLYDEDEQALDDCSGFWDGDTFMCMAVGSEQCEFGCPFNRDLGKTSEEIEQEVFGYLEEE